MEINVNGGVKNYHEEASDYQICTRLPKKEKKLNHQRLQIFTLLISKVNCNLFIVTSSIQNRLSIPHLK